MMSRRLSTFSIVGHDPTAEEWGIAVASKFLAVGSVAPWASAGVGAVATQSYANVTFGPAGLALMNLGYGAERTLQGLLAADVDAELRQVGIVDARGESATFTGSGCFAWAGGRTGRHYAAQGNLLAGPEVVDAMSSSFESSSGDLVDRLVAAIQAGQGAGGDRRGQQSTAVLVVKSGGGYGGGNDRYVDLRIDDHPRPIDELQRLVKLHKLYMFESRPEDILPLDDDRTRTVQIILRSAGLREAPADGVLDAGTAEAMRELCAAENLEGRWREGAEIDRVVLEYLQERYGV